MLLLLLLLHAATLAALLVICEVKKRNVAATKKVTSRLVGSEATPAPATSRAVSRERVRPIADDVSAVSPSSSARPPTTNKASSLTETTNDAATTETNWSSGAATNSAMDDEDEDEKDRNAAEEEFRKLPTLRFDCENHMTIDQLCTLAAKDSGLSIELRAIAIRGLNGAIERRRPHGFDDKLKALATNLIEEFNIEMKQWVKMIFGVFIREIAGEWMNEYFKVWSTSEDVPKKQKALEIIKYGNNWPWMGERDWGEEAKKLVVNSIQGSNRSLRMTALEALQGATLDDDRWKVLLPIIITMAEEKCKGPPVERDFIKEPECAHIIAMEHLCDLARNGTRWKLLRPHVGRIVATAKKELIHQFSCVSGGHTMGARVLLQYLLERFGGDFSDNIINDILVACLIEVAADATDLFDEWLSETPEEVEFMNGLWVSLLTAIKKHIGDGRCGEQMMSLATEFCKSDEWSRRVAAMVTWTEVIDEKWGQERVNILIDHALLGFTDQHPKVRAAAADLIRRVSCFDDLIIDGYEDLPQKVISSLISLAADPVRPVRVQALHALTCVHIMGILTPDLMSRSYDELLPLVIAIIVDCPSDKPNIIHAYALKLVTALARAVGGDRFRNNLPAIEAAVGPLLENLEKSNKYYNDICESVQGMSEAVANKDCKFSMWIKSKGEE